MPSSNSTTDELRSRRRTRTLLYGIAAVAGIAFIIWVSLVDVQDGLYVAMALTALCAYPAVRALVISREIHQLTSKAKKS